MGCFLDGMSIETRRHQSTSREKTEEDTSISSGNLGEVSLSISDTLQGKMYGTVMESA